MFAGMLAISVFLEHSFSGKFTSLAFRLRV